MSRYTFFPQPPIPKQSPIYFLSLDTYLFGHFIVMGFCVWLLSLSIMFSRFNHVVTCITISFIFVAELDSIVWIYNILFIHSPVDGDFFWFFFLAALCGMRDLSSLTRDGTHAPCNGSVES